MTRARRRTAGAHRGSRRSTSAPHSAARLALATVVGLGALAGGIFAAEEVQQGREPLKFAAEALAGHRDVEMPSAAPPSAPADPVTPGQPETPVDPPTANPEAGQSAPHAPSVAVPVMPKPGALPVPFAPDPGNPGGSLKVVGLGDSVASGFACECMNYVDMVSHRLGDRYGRPVDIANEAYPGAFSQDVLDQLAEEEAQKKIRESDLVVVGIGANDFSEEADNAFLAECRDAAASSCYADTAKSMRANLDAILTKVKALQQRPGAQVVVLGYWNVYADGEVGRAHGPEFVAGSNSLTKWVNQMIAQSAADHQALYADAYAAFKGDGTQDTTDLLAPDGEHPGPAGHQLLAEAVLSALGDHAVKM
ncbi:SGNH/GDSL hydrolase family protein [Austwickia chelonae]|uniref:SGNH/GDSL hydrolase family protein n=1 Tax=Austwickia chelonae TaxID=100225 RepID=UPI0013C2B975|nr:SGNH/GDSL hydrolase family protein [Austwickia chelonae]